MSPPGAVLPPPAADPARRREIRKARAEIDRLHGFSAVAAQMDLSDALPTANPDDPADYRVQVLVESSESQRCVCRFDADPAADAIPLAVAIADHLGAEHCGPSLLALAKEGSTGLWYSDLESFETASIGLLRKR